MFLSIAAARTAPPCSSKNSGKSVPPPKKLMRRGVWQIIICALSAARNEILSHLRDASPSATDRCRAPCPAVRTDELVAPRSRRPETSTPTIREAAASGDKPRREEDCRPAACQRSL